MSTLVKSFTILAIPLGMFYGAVPIYMEESKLWTPFNSLTYFALTIPFLFGLAFLLWPTTTLYARAVQRESR